MGRVKIPPTPRAASLNDAMKAAAARIGPPTADDFANSAKASKQVSRNSLPTPRGSQDRATSEPAGKRKAASESKASSVIPAKDTKLALRSSAKPAISELTDPTALEATLDPINDGPPSKRQKVNKPSPAPRRSGRSKTAKDSPASTAKKTLRSSSRAKQSSKVVDDDLSGTATPASEQQEVESTSTDDQANEGESVAVPMITGGTGDDTDAMPSPSSALGDPRPTSTGETRRDSGPPLRETMSLPPPGTHIGGFIGADTLDPALGGNALPIPSGSMSTGITEEQILSMPGQQAHYGIPPPGSWIQTPNGMVQIGADGLPLFGPGGNTVAGHMPPRFDTNGQPLPYYPNRRGQKVKGRPTPKKASSANGASPLQAAQTPDMNEEDTEAKSRALANTYPRKQPFKAQIEFPGYPPPNAEIPASYTMWDICQLMPNSLREGNLRAFVQREWSANELCACLKDDARAVLNARPGKDKTMVFQKRMERIKKDLVAKGEYDALLRSAPLREDGRPTWVKRGNVRRK